MSADTLSETQPSHARYPIDAALAGITVPIATKGWRAANSTSIYSIKQRTLGVYINSSQILRRKLPLIRVGFYIVVI